jgi:hypothetical protein
LAVRAIQLRTVFGLTSNSVATSATFAPLLMLRRMIAFVSGDTLLLLPARGFAKTK